MAEGAHYYSGADAGGFRAGTVSELSTHREEGLGVMYLYVMFCIMHSCVCMMSFLCHAVFRPSAHVHCSVYPHVLSVNVYLSVTNNPSEST